MNKLIGFEHEIYFNGTHFITEKTKYVHSKAFTSKIKEIVYTALSTSHADLAQKEAIIQGLKILRNCVESYAKDTSRIKRIIHRLFGMDHSAIVRENIEKTISFLNEAHLTKGAIIYDERTKKFHEFKPAPPIKTLVFSGGSERAIILPGVIKAFEEHKPGESSLMEQLETLRGSSSGAIMALMLAVGTTSDELVDVLREIVDFGKLLGTSKYRFIKKDGRPLVSFLKKQIHRTIKNGIHDIAFDSELFRKIQEEVKKENSDDVCITFSMLSLLHELKPAIFKKLSVTATNIETGKSCIFDAEQTPNLDIAIACRASSSLPIILEPVEIDSKKYFDGGYLNNIPVPEKNDLQTLVLAYDENKIPIGQSSPFYDEVIKNPLYKITYLGQFFRDWLPQKILQFPKEIKNTIARLAGLEKVRMDYTQRVIPLFTDLHGTNYKKAKKHADKYYKKGLEQGREYLNLHRGEVLLERTFENCQH